ncbi:hypothetical protein TRSC58_03338 [Trypanosoma rangeli SC58]|uniref:Uncharacterized protein n=1 Tax=Trypanosoma rangeli SC58 TaxID=429131 RepID=A0A061J210_TRYRA|nr:hypothetical protein TRSC58_03338 [Trypanosoma rangeli SC58]
MSNRAASDFADSDASGSFHLIDPDTGLTVVGERGVDSAAQSGVGVMEAAERGMQAESFMSAVSQSTWSMLATTQLEEAPSLAPWSSSPDCPPSFSARRSLESTTPFHGDRSADEAAMMGKLVPSALSRRVRGDDNSSNDVDGQNKENGLPQTFLHAFAEAPPHLSAVDKNGDTSVPASASSREKLQLQNALLRSQLAEANKNSAHYMLLHEHVKEELQNLHKTLSLLLHGDSENEMNEYLGSTRTDVSQEREELQRQGAGAQLPFGRPTWLQQVLRMLGFESIPPPSPCRRYGCRSRRQRLHTPEAEGSSMSDGWKRHFSYAKWHARHGRAGPALESILLAISSDGFDAWRSLLVDEPNWNRLGGSDRQQWYCLVATKLAELLNRRGITLATTRLDEQCGASCSTEGELDDEGGGGEEQQQQAAPTDRCQQLTPDLLVPFLWRMSCNYAEEIKDNELSPAAEDAGTPSGELCLPPHQVIGAALEDLLSASISTFPGNAALCYLLASVRAVQGREEESLHQLKEVLHLDPSHLLREGCGCNSHPVP